MLKVENLSVHFEERGGRQEAVNGISFEINEGEVLGIVGESGSGKTMTALTIAGLMKEHAILDSGRILLDGTDLPALSEKEMRRVQGKDISMIFQEPLTALNPTMRIGEQVEEALLLHTALSKAERTKKVHKALEDAELSDIEALCRKYPHELSGGMRQRVMIAASIICRPKLLIADEPTTALDVITQDSILKLLKKLNKKYGMGILFISHNLRVVKELCSRVLVMKDGRIIEEGATEQVFRHPQKDYTKELIAAIPGRTEDNILRPAGSRQGEAGQLSACRPQKDKVLELKHVNAYYREGRKKKQVLEDVSFTLYKGETVGLAGESGSGKSTLCKCILGLLKEFEGEIIHYTKSPQMIFQDPFGSLNPKKTIGWILEEPLRVQGGFSKETRREKAEEMLKRVHLPGEVYQRYPRELSGGQRQRVSIALSLITGTGFILADEPLSALDVTVQAQIIALLKEIQEKENISCLFISHDLDVVSMLCERVLFLKDRVLIENQP